MYYDASGNPTFYVEGLGLTWTQGRRLASAGYGSTPSVTYSYNGDGLRTKKTLSSGNYVDYHILDGVYVGDTRVIGGVTYNTLYIYDDAGAVIGLQSNGTNYWFAKNLQGDVIGLVSNTGTVLARYTYDPWGKLTSVKNASGVTITDASNIALRNPFRYRSYMYDDETGFYYLRARYYDPLTKRFLNADEAETINATPSDVTDNNLFAYYPNIAITSRPFRSEIPKINNTFDNNLINNTKKDYSYAVRFNVPLYNQGCYSLCWAFCQVMVEDYYSGRIRTNEDATNRAISISQSIYGDDWNQGGWPTNSTFGSGIESIEYLFSILENEGPLYGYYCSSGGAHLIVITGVNLRKETVYTNNPWGIAGEQSFSQFLNGFAGMPLDWDMKFYFFMYAR